MALFKPYKILSSQLNSLPIVEGQFIITTDTQLIYADIAEGVRTLVGTAKGINVEISETEPSEMSEGDIWMVIEPAE